MLRPVDLDRMRVEAVSLSAIYSAAGVRVHWLDHSQAPPNLVFLRDTFFMTPRGAIVGRMASRQRAGEERLTAAFLATLGVPILATITDGTFEGADALWASGRRVLIGVGKRTDARGAAAVARVVADQDVDVAVVRLTGPVQHLLGAVNFADRTVAVCNACAWNETLARALQSYDVVQLPDSEELHQRRGMNFVTLRPGQVLMPAGCPRIQEQLERSNIATITAEIDEYINAAGGIGCLTGILERKEQA